LSQNQISSPFEEDERHIELIGIAPALCFAGAQPDASAFSFQDSERAALPVEQPVVGLAAIVEGIFEPDIKTIRQAPIGIPQELVDLDPGEGFVGHA